MKKIFIIDDDAIVRKLVKGALKNKYEVIEVPDPIDVLTLSIKNLPYLILLDLHMPNLDGFEIIRMLKNHPYTYDIPIICISADQSIQSKEEIIELGGIGMLQKPIDPQCLAETIESIMSSIFTQLTDRSGKYSFYFHYNAVEKEALIFDEIKACVETNIPTVLLSWDEGEKYASNPLFMETIKNGSLVYLEMSKKIPGRIRFLEDISPISRDLEALLPLPTTKCHLIVDEIKDIAISDSDGNVFNKILSFAEFLKLNFRSVTLINTKSKNPKTNDFLHTFAKSFVGVRA